MAVVRRVHYYIPAPAGEKSLSREMQAVCMYSSKLPFFFGLHHGRKEAWAALIAACGQIIVSVTVSFEESRQRVHRQEGHTGRAVAVGG